MRDNLVTDAKDRCLFFRSNKRWRRSSQVVDAVLFGVMG